jgi:hypothetical protein
MENVFAGAKFEWLIRGLRDKVNGQSRIGTAAFIRDKDGVVLTLDDQFLIRISEEQWQILRQIP